MYCFLFFWSKASVQYIQHGIVNIQHGIVNIKLSKGCVIIVLVMRRFEHNRPVICHQGSFGTGILSRTTCWLALYSFQDVATDTVMMECQFYFFTIFEECNYKIRSDSTITINSTDSDCALLREIVHYAVKRLLLLTTAKLNTCNKHGIKGFMYISIYYVGLQ